MRPERPSRKVSYRGRRSLLRAAMVLRNGGLQIPTSSSVSILFAEP